MTRNNMLVPANSSFSRLFDDPFFSIVPFATQMTTPSLPSVPKMALDIQETDEGYVIEADLPGASKDDVSISLEDDVMTISYEKKEEDKEENKDGYIVRERKSHVAVTRSIRVPEADENSAKATMENGVLKIEIAKTEPVETKKTIEIG